MGGEEDPLVEAEDSRGIATTAASGGIPQPDVFRIQQIKKEELLEKLATIRENLKTRLITSRTMKKL